MTQYYECHITLESDFKAYTQQIVENIGWIFSCIDNDIILGKGVKCYATMHYSYERFTQDDIIDKVQYAANALRRHDIKVIREKVELVLWDTKQKLTTKEIKNVKTN